MGDNWIMCFTLFVGMVIISVAASILLARRRRRKWEEFAARHNLVVCDVDDAELVGSLPVFTALSEGGSGGWCGQVVSGEANGSALALADYEIQSRNNHGASTRRKTVCVLRNSEMDAPHCYLARSGRTLELIAKIVGKYSQDINFDDDPEFSRSYIVKSEDEASAREFLTRAVRQRFVQLRKKNLHFEARGNTFVFDYSRRLTPDQAEEMMAQSFEFMNLITDNA